MIRHLLLPLMLAIASGTSARAAEASPGPGSARGWAASQFGRILNTDAEGGSVGIGLEGASAGRLSPATSGRAGLSGGTIALAASAALPDSFPDGTALIPFELLEGLLLVQASASGADSDTAGAFVLDTGAGYLALDHPLAKWLGVIDDTSRSNAVGLAPRPLQRLVVGDQTMDLVQPVLTIDGAIIRRVTDRTVLGLLGTRLYADRAVQIDYPARMLRLIPSTDPGSGAAAGAPSDPAAAAARSRRLLGRALGAGAVGVPFTLAGDGKILVRVRLGVSRFASSKPLTLILDTGATKTVLFRAALTTLGIDFERWRSLCGLSVPTLFGAPSACLVRMPRVNVEAFALDDAASDGAGRGKKPAGDADGSSAPAATDPAPGDAAAGAAPKAGRRMRPAVRAMLGDRATDVPSGGSAGKAAGSAGVAGPAVSPSAGAGAGTTTTSEPGDAAAGAATLRTATLRADDLDAIVMESELQEVLSRVVETPVHGLLGYTFLRHYRVTIDYPQRVAWFEPAADPDPRPFEYSHPGIQLERDGAALRVVAVADGSPAAREKVAVGDTLVSVDGREVSGQDLAQVARWLEGEPGTRVTLVVGTASGNRTVQVTRRRLL